MRKFLKLSVERTCPFYLLEIEGLLTEGSRPGRTFGESVGGILEMDSCDWSSGIRYHVFDSRSDTEFKVLGVGTSSGNLDIRGTSSGLSRRGGTCRVCIGGVQGVSIGYV